MPTFGAFEIWTILPRFLQIGGVAPETQLSTESIHHTELLPGSFASTIWVPTVVRFCHKVRVAGCVDPSLKTKVANQIVSVFFGNFPTLQVLPETVVLTHPSYFSPFGSR